MVSRSTEPSQLLPALLHIAFNGHCQLISEHELANTDIIHKLKRGQRYIRI